MVELELARKQAEETRIKSEEYQNSRVKIQKIKGVLNSIIFLVVIALYIFNLFQRFSFEKIYTMQNAIESALNDESYASLDQQTFYTLLISGMESSSAATTTQYAFFKLNYILKHITLVMTRYDAVSCVAESTYTTTYNVKCLDPNRMNEAPYTTSNGVTYNYIHNPPDSVSLDVPLGHFDNSGYRLDVELSLDTTTYTNYYNKIVDFADYTRGKYISFNFVVYNPSLEKMACVYRIFIHYNEDIYYFQNFVYVFNTEDRTTSEIVSADFLLALASILILSSVLELFHVIHESKEEFDLELYFRDLKRKKGMTTLSKEDEDFILKNKFWTFRSFGYIFKFYPPGFTYLLNLLTVVLILVSGALDLSLNNQINESGYLDNSEVNCAPLIKSNFANSIISSILILLLVLVLLKYISLFVPFLARFVRIIQSLISNVYTIGIIILAMILILTVFATYTFRPYFLDFTEFQQFYIALILMILKRNLIFLNGTADAEYDQMGHNIGTYAFVILILFLYVMLGLLIFKVITSIVIKSMKETQIDMKNEVNMSKAIHEKALNVMKEKLYEDLKANLRKQKASNKK